VSQVIFPQASKGLQRLNRNSSATLRLICFPCAGGSATTFRRWARFLPAMVELCGIDLPGRGSRRNEPVTTDFTAMMDALIQDLRRNPELPAVFFGHSLGAIVCFEAARWLRRAALPQPWHLFVSACHAPQNHPRGEPMSLLSDHELVQRLLCLDGTPPEILEDEEFVRDLMPALRGDLTLADSYRYQPEAPLDIPIWAFGGMSDQEVSPKELEDWRTQTRAGFEQKIFSGGHFYFQAAEREFLRGLSMRLETIAACRPTPIRSSGNGAF
jgi:medium-chain acyl-[acyl-carrier-protein] hydrolase